MQEIANRAGLAKSVMYRQFDGKDDLDRRIRTYLVDDLYRTLTTEMDAWNGSIEEILTRTVRAVADWAADQRSRHEFISAGPTHDDPGQTAVSTLKARMADRATAILVPITTLLGVDYEPFETLPYAVVTMVEGTLARWVRDPAPAKTRGEIVADLGAYAWFILDGATRSVGLTVAPTDDLATILKQLTGVDPRELSG